MPLHVSAPRWDTIAAALALAALTALAGLGWSGAHEARRRAIDEFRDAAWARATHALATLDAASAHALTQWATHDARSVPEGFVGASVDYVPEERPHHPRLRAAHDDPYATAAFAALAADVDVDLNVRTLARAAALDCARSTPSAQGSSADAATDDALPVATNGRARFALDRARARRGIDVDGFVQRLTAGDYDGVPPLERAYAAQDHAAPNDTIDALRALDALALEPDRDGAHPFTRVDGSRGFAWRHPSTDGATQLVWIGADAYAARCVAATPDIEPIADGNERDGSPSLTLRTVPLRFQPSASALARAEAAGAATYATRLAQVLASLVLCGACTALLVRLARRRADLDRQRNDFVCSVTHELKTPLSNILLYAETLERLDGADPGRVPEFARTIRAEAERLRGRIQQVLDVAAGRDAIEAAPGTTFEPLAVVEAVIAEATPGAKAKGATFVLASFGPVPRVRGSLELLAQAVSGLLDNAVKFGGAATVRVRVRVHDGEILIDVADEGPGIAPKDRPHVFEPFWRASSAVAQATPGSGLGLALVRRCVERLRGRVDLLPTSESRGATFRIAVPAET